MLIGVITAVLAGVLGVLAGWWTTLAIYRLPRGEPIHRSWPRCENCREYLAGKDLIPVLSWIRLRGRCRSCRAPLGYRFLMLELGTGLLFAVLALRFGVSVELIAYLYLAVICVALFVIDVKTHRLPDALTLPAYVVIVALFVVAALAGSDWWDLLRALLAGLLLFAGYYVLAIAVAGALGFGDVKLAGLLGLALGWIGWQAVVAGTLLGFLYGGVFSVVLLLARKANSKTKIAFGPFMMLGAMSAVFFGSQVDNVLPLMVLG